MEGIKYDYDNLKENDVIKKKVEWLLERCVLETAPNLDETGKCTDENGKRLLNSFLELDHVKVLIGRVLDKGGTEDKYSLNKDIEEVFFDFLSKNETENEQDEWKKYPEDFINKVEAYRENPDSNIAKVVMEFAKNINNDPLRYIYELIQNADDCEYEEGQKKEVTIELREKEMLISYPEKGMSPSDILAISTIGQSNKKKKKRKRIIGEKGIGFKTIFSACDLVNIHSGPFYFRFNSKSLSPNWISKEDFEKEGFRQEIGTTMILNLKSEIQDTVYKEILEKYGVNKENTIIQGNMLKNCPIFFTNQIESLKIIFKDSYLEMSKEEDKVNGRLTVVYKYRPIGETIEREEKLECFRFEKSVQFTYEEYISHYKTVLSKEEFESIEKSDNKEIITYPIVLIAPRNLRENNDLTIKEGNVFTYLPTFTNIKAPLAIQIPYELNQDRSCMWLEGLDRSEIDSSTSEEDFEENNNTKIKTTKWNSRLFREAFVSEVNNPSLIERFYLEMAKREDVNILDYLPSYQDKNYQFFHSCSEKYDEALKILNEYCGQGSENRIFKTIRGAKFLKMLEGTYRSPEEQVILFDDFVTHAIEGLDEGSLEELKRFIKIIEAENIR